MRDEKKKRLFLRIVILRGREVSELHRYHQDRFVGLRNVRVNGPRTLDAIEDASGNRLDLIIIAAEILIDPVILARLIAKYIDHILATLHRRMLRNHLHPPVAALYDPPLHFLHF